jgi:hypothetical protein
MVWSSSDVPSFRTCVRMAMLCFLLSATTTPSLDRCLDQAVTEHIDAHMLLVRCLWEIKHVAKVFCHGIFLISRTLETFVLGCFFNHEASLAGRFTLNLSSLRVFTKVSTRLFPSFISTIVIMPHSTKALPPCARSKAFTSRSTYLTIPTKPHMPIHTNLKTSRFLFTYIQPNKEHHSQSL